jgi:NAD-dependent dihydropyrimidine dehydrogenase PreA subunit
VACATCVEACPLSALSIDGDWAVVNWDKCLGCGVCEGQCPNSAITLVRDENKGEPLDVRALVKSTSEPRNR